MLAAAAIFTVMPRFMAGTIAIPAFRIMTYCPFLVAIMLASNVAGVAIVLPSLRLLAMLPRREAETANRRPFFLENVAVIVVVAASVLYALNLRTSVDVVSRLAAMSRGAKRTRVMAAEIVVVTASVLLSFATGEIVGANTAEAAMVLNSFVNLTSAGVSTGVTAFVRENFLACTSAGASVNPASSWTGVLGATYSHLVLK